LLKDVYLKACFLIIDVIQMGNLSDGCVLLFCQVEATAIRIRDQREAVEAQLEAFGFNILTVTKSTYPLFFQ